MLFPPSVDEYVNALASSEEICPIWIGYENPEFVEKLNKLFAPPEIGIICKPFAEYGICIILLFLIRIIVKIQRTANLSLNQMNRKLICLILKKMKVKILIYKSTHCQQTLQIHNYIPSIKDVHDSSIADSISSLDISELI
jgi:hypothetical protein